MKERYSVRPESTWLEALNEKPGAECTLHFCENITTVDEDDGEGNVITSFEADHYTVKTRYREGLLGLVKASRAVWLAKAKQQQTEEKNFSLLERVTELEEVTKGLVGMALMG